MSNYNILTEERDYVEDEAYSFINHLTDNDIKYISELYKKYSDNEEEFVYQSGYIIGDRVDSDIKDDLEDVTSEEIMEYLSGVYSDIANELLSDKYGITLKDAENMIYNNDKSIGKMLRDVCFIILTEPISGFSSMWNEILNTFGLYLLEDIKYDNKEKWGIIYD